MGYRAIGLYKNGVNLITFFQVDEAEPSFPRPVSYWWFGCKSQPKGRIPKPNTSFGGGSGRTGGGFRGQGDGVDILPVNRAGLDRLVVISGEGFFISYQK